MTWLERAALTAARFAGTRGSILCFHGIDLPEAPSPSSMHVSLELFEAIVHAIRRVGQIVSLEEIVANHRAGRSTLGQVAFTSDDAYASLLSAVPLLQRLEVPLTVFAVTDALATGSTFWWDRIEDAAVRTGADRWSRFEDECGLPTEYRAGHPARAGRILALRQWVLAEGAGRWPKELIAPLEKLEAEAGYRTSQRSMTEAELAGFLSDSGAQLGVHTVSHAALPFLPDNELTEEVTQGHERLKARFGTVVPHLAIPYGLFDQRTLQLTQAAGLVPLTLQGAPLDRPFQDQLGVSRICVVREHRPGLLALKASALAGPLQRIRSGVPSRYPVLPSATT